MVRGTKPGDTRSVGLGLYIVREIAGAHGGRSEVGPDATDGTTFNITLPRHAGAAHAAGSVIDAARSGSECQPSAPHALPRRSATTPLASAAARTGSPGARERGPLSLPERPPSRRCRCGQQKQEDST